MNNLLDNYIESARQEEQLDLDAKHTPGFFNAIIGFEKGRKYHKVYRTYTMPTSKQPDVESQRSVHSFVDVKTGRIFSAKSWKQKGSYIDDLFNYSK